MLPLRSRSSSPSTLRPWQIGEQQQDYRSFYRARRAVRLDRRHAVRAALRARTARAPSAARHRVRLIAGRTHAHQLPQTRRIHRRGPNRWLIDNAVDSELGRDIFAVKQPTFDETDDFSLSHLGPFDFVLAQGVATNTGPSLLPRLLCAIAQTLAPTGIAAATFFYPGSGDDSALQVQIDDHGASVWCYLGCYSYARSAITAAGLEARPVGWYHPRHQWWLMSCDISGLPPEAFLAKLTGPTLAEGCEASWQWTS